MSHCPQCWVGQCKKHRLQDHGRREAAIKAKVADPQATLKKMYDTLVAKQVDKLEAAAAASSDKAQKGYRARQEKSRAKAEKRANKLTKEQQERAKEMRLGGHLLGMMLESDEDEDEEGEEEKRKEKKDKKKRKEEKKRKKEKKHKKKKKRKREEKAGRTESDSDCKSSDEDEGRKSSSKRKRRRKRSHSDDSDSEGYGSERAGKKNGGELPSGSSDEGEPAEKAKGGLSPVAA